jgi:hypothetical protein
MIGDAVSDATENVADRIAEKLEAVGLKASLFLAAGVAIVLAVIAASVALGWWLATLMSVPAAALIVALLYVALSVIAILIAQHAIRSGDAEPVEPMEVVEDEAEATMDELGLPQFLLVAAGIGAALGMRTGSSEADADIGPSVMSLVSSVISVMTTVHSLQRAQEDTGVADSATSSPSTDQHGLEGLAA